MNGVVVAWYLKSQKTITLLVTENEFTEVTELCC